MGGTKITSPAQNDSNHIWDTYHLFLSTVHDTRHILIANMTRKWAASLRSEIQLL